MGVVRGWRRGTGELVFSHYIPYPEMFRKIRQFWRWTLVTVVQ